MNWHQIGAAGLVGAVLGIATAALIHGSAQLFRLRLSDKTKSNLPVVASIAAFAASTSLGDTIFDYLPDSWSEISSSTGAFAVSFPCSAESSDTVIETALGPQNLYSSSCASKLKGRHHAVTFFDYPDWIPMDDEATEELLDSSVEGMVGNVDGTLIHAKRIVSNGHPGRAVEFKAKGVVGHARVLLASRRLYIVLVVEPPGRRETIRARFFDSFRLTGMSPAPTPPPT